MRAPLALAAVALLALAGILLPLLRPVPPPPAPLSERELEELAGTMERLRERALSDAPLSEAEQAASLAEEVFRQFKKGGFRRVLSNDPERALRARSALQAIDPEARAMLEQALGLVQPALSPDFELGQAQVKALPAPAFAEVDRAFDGHLGVFARRLLEYCRTNQV